MLASFPASMLNQKPSDLGILNRFKLDPSRSSGEAMVNSDDNDSLGVHKSDVFMPCVVFASWYSAARFEV
jgi:hypothetical protein